MDIRFRMILSRVCANNDTEAYRTATCSDGLYRHRRKNLEGKEQTVPKSIQHVGAEFGFAHVKFSPIYPDNTMRRTLIFVAEFDLSVRPVGLYDTVPGDHR
jgi:hypothetical protein